MANEYVTATELKTPLGITDTIDDPWIVVAATSASRAIDAYCNRRFYADTNATSRVFRPTSAHLVKVDDISTTTSLVIKTDPDNSGTFGTTWTTADYELLPLNGVRFNVTGWPYEQILAVYSLTFPINDRASVQVTAKWGWATPVPDPVKQAAYILGAELFKRKDAPFGVAGVADFGVIRIREDARLQALLAPYRRIDGVAG